MAIQIPHNPLIQSVPMAEYANQFAQLKGNQQQNTLRQMQIDQAPQQLARQQRLDEQSSALNQANIDEKDTKGMAQKHAYAKQLATWMVSQAEKSGMQEGTPEFQQYLEKVGAPVRPMMAKMFGQPEMLTKPMDWNSIKTLAQGPDLSGSEQKDNYVFGYDAKGNPVRMNKANGLGGALIDERTGQPMQGSAQYSPQAIAARENAKQGQMGHVLDNSLYTGQQLNSAYGAPQQPQQPQISTDFHDNPTPVDSSQYGTVEATPQEAQDYGYKIGGQPVVQPQRNMPMTPEQKKSLDVSSSVDEYAQKKAIDAKTPKPLTESQSKDALFGDRATKANEALNAISDKYSPAALNAATGVEGVPLVGWGANAMLGDNEQLAGQAQRDFINAVLRKESGAAISPSEFDNARKQYFPQPGDGDKVLAQKKLNRETEIQGLLRGAGSANFADSPANTEGGLTDAEKKELGELKARYKR